MESVSLERRARVHLNLHPKMGPVKFAALVERFGGAAGALEAAPADWEILGPEGPALKRELAGLDPIKEGDRAARLGGRILCGLDEEYPEGLRNLRDAPIVLYLWGAFEPRDAYSVALVGARVSSAYGRAAAERLARELAEAGVTVVSGLARGIDAASHAGALAAGGRTIGFLGSGLNDFYPRENRALADRMAKSGAVATEFPLDAIPDAGHFPRRNRLISAMSLGVVVVEARAKSGALLTAKLAAEQGKDVFAVPGSIFSEGSRGPHLLIREGAKPVECASDLVEEISAFNELTSRRSPAPAPPEPRLSGDESRLLNALSWEPRGVDSLCEGTGFAAARITAALLALELAGLSRELPGKRFVRTERAMTLLEKGGI